MIESLVQPSFLVFKVIRVKCLINILFAKIVTNIFGILYACVSA